MTRSIVLAILPLLALGCQDPGPDVVHIKTPRLELPKRAAEVKGNDRMLAVLVKDKDKTWSFRLSGPEAAVAAHQEKFDEFLKTVKFGVNPPLSWKLPDGWVERPGNAMRFATIVTSPEPKQLEVTVVNITGLDLLGNVNRWRGQLSLPPVAEKDLGAMTKPIDVGGERGTLVDLVGRFGADKTAPMKGPPAEPAALKYDVPEGWVKVKPKNVVIRDQFDVGEEKGEATIVVLPGGAGGEVANLQRWRQQVKLPPKDIKELIKDFVRIDTGLGKAAMVDIHNPELKGVNRILGVMIPTPEATYFLKLMGPSDLVEREKGRFEAFAKSLKEG